MRLQSKAYVYAFLAIGCWSTIGSAFKITLRYTTPSGLLLISSFTACIVLLAILLVRGRFSVFKELTFKDIIRSAFLGLLNPFLYYIVLLKAYDILPAQMAGTLNYIWPLVLVLLSVHILKQKISLWSIFAILVSFTGILVISWQPGRELITKGAVPEDKEMLTGICLAVGSALFWAFYWIFNVKDKWEPVTRLFLNFMFGFLYTLIFIAITQPGFIGGWQALAGGVYIGVFEMGLTFVLWLNALRFSVTTAKVSNLIYISPFVSLIFIHFAVGENITVFTITGLILIVSGILFQQYLK